jgi:hypothetical protein
MVVKAEFVSLCMDKVEVRRKLDHALDKKAQIYQGIVFNTIKDKYTRTK